MEFCYKNQGFLPLIRIPTPFDSSTRHKGMCGSLDFVEILYLKKPIMIDIFHVGRLLEI